MPKKPKTSAKKSEESIAEEDKKDESLALETESSPTEDQTEVLDPPKDPSPEPIYDEPVLSELIIETWVLIKKKRNKYNVVLINAEAFNFMYER